MSIKEHFTSRFEDGYIINADWSSLELVGWAFLTRDPILIKLIREGKDPHRYVGGMVLNCRPEEVDDATRKQLKTRNFLLVYGGYWTELVRSHGMSEDDAKRLYETFWKAFPTAKLWQDNVCRSIEASKIPNGKLTPGGNPQYTGYYKNITGRKFWFNTYDLSSKRAKYSNKLTDFKRPEMVNYPVQSFSTADIHMIALGILYREIIKHRDKAVLINTVHDSVMVDCKKEFLDFTCKMIKDSLESVIERLDSAFNIQFDLPLKVEVEYGKSWNDMTKYEFNNNEAMK